MKDATPEQIASALATLDLTADKLFDRIQSDLNRGLIKEARSHLNFIDVLRGEKK